MNSKDKKMLMSFFNKKFKDMGQLANKKFEIAKKRIKSDATVTNDDSILTLVPLMLVVLKAEEASLMKLNPSRSELLIHIADSSLAALIRFYNEYLDYREENKELDREIIKELEEGYDESTYQTIKNVNSAIDVNDIESSKIKIQDILDNEEDKNNFYKLLDEFEYLMKNDILQDVEKNSEIRGDNK